MTLSEFKAWFEGYTEGLEAAPTKAQFDRIKEKVKEITGTPITQTVFLDSYRRYYDYSRPYWTSGFLSMPVGSGTIYAQNAANATGETDKPFDSAAAMYALGKAEAVN